MIAEGGGESARIEKQLQYSGEYMSRLFWIVFFFSIGTQADGSILKHLGLNQKAETKALVQKKEDRRDAKGCATPRSSLKTFLYSDVQKSIQCFDDFGRSKDELTLLSERLQAVFRANGIAIDLDAVPDDEDFRDPNSRQYRYSISPQLKSIYLEKVGDRWAFPKASIDTIDSLYASATRLDLGKIYSLVPAWATNDLFGVNGFNVAKVFFLLLVILLGLTVRLITMTLVARQVGRIFLKFKLTQFEMLLRRAASPIGNLAMALLVAAFVPGLDFNVHITRYLLVAVRMGAGISVVMLAYRSVDVIAYFMMERALLTHSKLDDQLVPLFRRGLKITTLVVGTLFVLQNLNVDVTSLLAGVTIGGLAFSFAARDTVANLFGSITIFADKPFLVGDWVKSSGVEGMVESVGFRSTRIRTFYNSLVSVPNSKFTDSVVDNMGARIYRRTLAEVGIAYDTDPDLIEAFCNGIRAIIKAHPKTRKDYYEVHLTTYGDFSLKIMLYFFFKVNTWPEELRSRHEIYLDVLRLAKEMGIRFAFPTQSIRIEHMVKAEDPKESVALDQDAIQQVVEAFAPDGKNVIPAGPRMGEGYFAHKP